MDIQKINPQLRRVYQYLPAIPFHNRSTQRVLRLIMHLTGRVRLAGGVKVEKIQIGPASLRVYRPLEGSSGAGMVWMHGGGFVIGTASQDDGICSNFARDLKLVVVSVEYRLAPEFPFPAALDDCFAAWKWLLEHADDFSLDPARIAIGGESAGGGLAACLAQRISDSGGIQPAAQVLFYPMLDDRTALNRDLDDIKHPLWNNHNNRSGWTAYLGHEPGQTTEPDYAVASRREDLSRLSPAWIGVGDIDLFYQENRLYSQRLDSAGVKSVFHQVPMAPHGFQVIAPRAQISREFYQKVNQFLIQELELDPVEIDTGERK